MKITYGIRNNVIDVTKLCKERLLTKNNIIVIPSGDNNRTKHFTDPIEGIKKKIFIENDGIISEYEDNVEIEINIINNVVIGTKLENIHSKLKIKHNAGFFSCCSVKLHEIVKFINLNKRLPDNVDSSKQFMRYKKNQDEDITFDYFENYENVPDVNIIYPINYKHNYQYKKYADLDYKCITPLIKKYFSPSAEINKIINNIEKKYNLLYENICVLFYRGNDKNRETIKCSYDEYLIYANQLLQKNQKLVFLVQSDETEFIEFITNKFPNNSFYFKDEIRHMKKCNNTVDNKMKSQNYEFSKKYLAITIIMSKCKYIICGSGNCDIWIMFYRKNNKNVIQNLNTTWYNSAF